MSLRRTVLVIGTLALALGSAEHTALAQPSGDSPVNGYFGTFGSAVTVPVPAYHGLEPALQLSYSSSASNGLGGVGWTLSGVGTIERASPGRGTPLYTSADVFVLDGQALVPCAAGSTSPSCTTGGTHSTRIESYQRIRFDSATNTWTISRKDGTQLVYSAVYGVTAGTFRWGLTRTRDTRGNQVDYAWWCGDGDCYPDSVSYNGTVIRFYREARPDPFTFPTGSGGLGKTAYRLKTLDVTVNGARWRSIRLTYSTSASTGRSLLTGVQELGRDATLDTSGTAVSGTALPARSYSYDSTATTARNSTWTGGHGNGDSGWSYADIDGDGKAEYVTHSGNGTHYATFFNRNGTLTNKTWTGGHGNGDSGWSYADIDGDGKAEYVTHSGNGTHYATFFNANGTITNKTWAGGHGNGDSGWSYADIDGDGKAEYVTHSGNGTHYATFFNVAGAVGSEVGTVRRGAGDSGWSYADIDGDGKAEYVTHSGNGTHYATFFNRDGTITNKTWTGGHGNGDSGWTYADINGDGRAEYVTHSGNGTHYATFFNGTTLENRTWTGGHGNGDSGWTYTDINGDGKVEYVTHSSNGAHYTTYFGDTTVMNSTRWGHGNGDSGSSYADIDGDGKTDYVTHSGNGTHYATWLDSGADLMLAAQSSSGGTTTVEYTPSSAWPNTYLPLGAVLQTASAVTVSDGRGASSTTRYSYQGALWSSSERRFLGFRKVTAVLDAAGNYTETYYHQHVGCISKPEVTYYRDPAGNLYKYSTFGYSENSSAPYTSLMTDRWEYECNQGAACRRTLLQIGYDQYGNGYLTYEHGDYDVAGDERTSLRGLYPNTGAYIVGLPAYENLYAGIGTSGTLIRQTLNEYDGNGTYAAAPVLGQVSRQLAWNNQSGGYSIRSFGYDAFGNVISETDPRGSVTRTAYDSIYHTHIVQRCDPLNHCASKTWDGGLDLIASETDLNGSVTTYTHDALGRPLQTTLPDGSAETYAYLDFGNPALQRIRKTQADGSADGLWTEVYEDGLGRRYRSVKKGGLTQDTYYNDGSSRVWKQSAWYAAGETPQLQVFSFDGLGRLRTVTNPDGTVGQRVYGNGYVAAYDELGHEKVTFSDAYGRTSQIREKNGAAYQYTMYQYDLLGNLTRLTDASGNASTISWDSLGRKLSACDPDTGCSYYTYDAGGLMLSHKNARNQTTTFTYDAAARPLTKTYHNGQQVRWTHDEAGHGAAIGATTTIVDPSGSESRNFDFAGRLTSVTKCVSDICKTSSRSYDLAGRPARVTYPDGEQVAYGYDSAGRLTSVGGYVTGIAYNGQGQITALGYANGTTTAFSYNATRQWLASVTVTSAPSGTLYQASYGYDAAARVTSMASSTSSLSNLGFAYDDLNRLTGVSGAQTQTLGYDALGNITANSQVGSYGYGDTSHRHAATSAGAAGFTYDATGNMLSGNGRTLEWDSENRLTKVIQSSGVTTFAYDSTGQRVLKSGPGGTTYSFGGLMEQGPSGTTKYYYAGPLLVARRDSSGPVWFHQDHLGSVRALSNASGAKVASYDYAPFGARIAVSAQVTNTRAYGGHELDDTGLVYMNARYYDPQLGRFLSPDNLVPASDNPQALNRYAYVYNNPISNADPTGHLPVVAAIATAVSVGAAAGFTSTVFVIAAVGAATITAGYVLKDPLLTSIGSVLLGVATGYTFGAGFLGAKETVQAAWVSGSVSALTSPVSPLDSKLKSAIGWAYSAQSLLYEFNRLDENIQKGADKLSEKIELNNPQFEAAKTQRLDALPDDLKLLRDSPEKWTAWQQRYGEAVETATRGAIKAGEAIALNPTGGLVGPGGGLGTRVLDALTGWIPGVRAHSVLHDLSGFLFNEFGKQGFAVGGGYLYLGLNWFGLSAGSPLSGQIEGLSVTGGNSVASLFPRFF